MGEQLYPEYGKTKKYDIPLSHLDYNYVKSCSDVKELEKILQVLRSGDEGCYPELEACTEKKLEEVNPQSRILRKEVPVSSVRDIPKDEREELETDLKSWTSDMKSVEENFKKTENDTPDELDLPPIRFGPVNVGMHSTKSEKQEKISKKPVKPREYRDWDKVDVDKELEKIDQEEEKQKDLKQKIAAASQNVLENLEKEINTRGMTLEEKFRKANREKDKGNEAFKSNDFEESILYYSRSLSLLPTAASYNNRALSYLKTKNWNAAISDCQEVLKLEPQNVKALLRRGTAYKEMKDVQRAEKDFKEVLKLEPLNKRAKDLLEQNEAARKERKAKGRRMVIKEVDGNDVKKENELVSCVNGIQEENIEEISTTNSGTRRAEVKQNGFESRISNREQKQHEIQQNRTNNKDIWNSEEVETNSFIQNNSADLQKESVETTDEVPSISVETNCATDTPDTAKLKQKNNGAVLEDRAHKKEEEMTYSDLDKSEEMQDTSEDKPQTVEDSQLGANITQTHTRPVLVQLPFPDDVGLLRQDGNTLFRAGQYGDAMHKYSLAIEKLEKVPEDHCVNLSLLYSNRAACRFKTGDCTLAINDCCTSLELVPHSVKALLRRAAAYEAKEKYRHAYVDYKHILSIDSHVTQAQQGATRCQHTLKATDGTKWREKLPPLQTVYSWELPDIIPAGLKNGSLVSTPETTSSKVPEAPISETLAKEVYPAVAEKTPLIKSEEGSVTKPEDPESSFNKLKSQGNQHVQKNEFKQAVECYSQCMELLPDRVVPYTNRALCYLRLNKAKEALEDCTQALKYEPENTKAFYRRAQAKKMLQHYKDSLQDLFELLKIEPNNGAAKKEVEIVKAYYKQELEKQKTEQKVKEESKQPPKSSKKQRKRMKIVEVDEDEEEPVKDKTKIKSAKTTEKQKTSNHSSVKSSQSSLKDKSSSPNLPSTKYNQSSNKSKSKSAHTEAPPVPPSVPKLGKATPYEFLQAWNSLKISQGVQPYAELLRQISPDDLPKVISNKLDGPMLEQIIYSLSQEFVDKGDLIQGFSILKNLCKVPRFGTISMFMSDQEKKEVMRVFAKLSSSDSDVYSESDINQLKKDYGIKS